MQIVAPHKRKMIESLENEEELVEFKAQLQDAAENAKAVRLLVLTGNSYGVGFFKEFKHYLEKIPSIEVIHKLKNRELSSTISLHSALKT